MAVDRVLVIGATGNVGSQAVQALVGKGVGVRAFSRDAGRAAGLGPAVEAFEGDLDRPETLAPAFDGVDKVFVVAGGNNIPAEDANVIDEAEKAGVGQVVLLSSLGVEHGVASGPMHQPGEERLRASALPWTILRPSVFMSNALMWRDTILAQGVFYEPTGSGSHAMIHPGDIGAVAAEVLTSDGHDGRTYELTGPEAVTSAQCAAALAAALSIDVRHVDVPDQAFHEGLSQAGLPPMLIDSLAGYFAMVKAGEFAMVTSTMRDLLGRPGRTFDEWAVENRAAFVR
ncbi:MAG: NAD(P)H-binding protein [Actinomycetota bacterium]|nr:NAD(P)H-binding protein [Actinomycetota bacterium]